VLNPSVSVPAEATTFTTEVDKVAEQNAHG